MTNAEIFTNKLTAIVSSKSEQTKQTSLAVHWRSVKLELPNRLKKFRRMHLTLSINIFLATCDFVVLEYRTLPIDGTDYQKINRSIDDNRCLVS